MKHLPALALLALSLCAVPTLSAQDNIRRIDVSGEAEIRVEPDQALIGLGVESYGKTLAEARADNDSRIARILKLPEVAVIDKRYVQTTHASVNPQLTRDKAGNVTGISGYRIKKNLSITLKDLSKLDNLLTSLLNAGANQLDGVQFQSSELRKHRDEARVQAIRAARDKASALAGELGQKLGKPLQISELAAEPIYGTRAMTQNVIMEDAGVFEGGPTMAIGQIVIRASVSVSFELQ